MPFARWLLVAMVLLSLSAPGVAQKKQLILVGHPPDGHPPATHEYVAGLRVLGKCLETIPGLAVTQVEAVGAWKQGPELMRRADGVVLFVSQGAQWLQADPERHKALQAVAKRGGGLSVLHWGMGTRKAEPITPFLQLFGGCHGGPDRKYIVVETQAELADPKHPILTGVNGFKVKDEFYYRLKFVRADPGINPLLRVEINGEKETVGWSWERADGGRSFGFSGLHFHANWRMPEYRRMVAQGVLWSIKLPIPKDGLAVKVSDNDLKLLEKK